MAKEKAIISADNARNLGAEMQRLTELSQKRNAVRAQLQQVNQLVALAKKKKETPDVLSKVRKKQQQAQASYNKLSEEIQEQSRLIKQSAQEVQKVKSQPTQQLPKQAVANQQAQTQPQQKQTTASRAKVSFFEKIASGLAKAFFGKSTTNHSRAPFFSTVIASVTSIFSSTVKGVTQPLPNTTSKAIAQPSGTASNNLHESRQLASVKKPERSFAAIANASNEAVDEAINRYGKEAETGLEEADKISAALGTPLTEDDADIERELRQLESSMPENNSETQSIGLDLTEEEIAAEIDLLELELEEEGLDSGFDSKTKAIMKEAQQEVAAEKMSCNSQSNFNRSKNGFQGGDRLLSKAISLVDSLEHKSNGIILNREHAKMNEQFEQLESKLPRFSFKS